MLSDRPAFPRTAALSITKTGRLLGKFRVLGIAQVGTADYGARDLEVKVLSRRGARRAVVGALLAALWLAIPAAAGAETTSPGNIAPIVGTWNAGGAVINVVGGGGSFQGTVVSGQAGSCGSGAPGTVFWKNLHGAGFNYSGQIPFVHSDDCSSAGDGAATFTLSDIDHGTWSAISPGDGKTYTGSFTRQGTWPGAAGNSKPDTSCKKNGKPILCVSQKNAVHDRLAEAKAIAKLYAEINKAFQAKRHAHTPEALIAAEDRLADLSAKVTSILTGREKIGLPTVTLPNLTKDWKKLKLPTKDQALGLASHIPGDAGKLFGFTKEANQALQKNNDLLQTAQTAYETNPGLHAELDTAADYAITGVHYDQLSTEDKLKAAYRVEGALGKQFDFSNSAADLGKAGVKFAYTLKGVKL
jgi:hypothetical protein